MKTILTILSILILSGCATQNRCDRKYPPQISTTVKDSISITYDTVSVEVTYIHYDTILHIKDSLVTVIRYREDGTAYSDYSFLENEFCKSLAVVNGKLKHELELKQQTRVLTGVQVADIINTYVQHFRDTKEVEIREVNQLTWWQRVLIVLGWVFVGSTVAMVGYVILKLKLK